MSTGRLFRRKRFLLLALVAALAVLLAGCTGQQSPEPAVTRSATEEPTSSPTPPSSGEGTPSAATTAELADRYFRSDAGQGGIWVEVVWATPRYLELTGNQELGLAYESERYLLFLVNLTTHSGNLLEYDFTGKVVLKIRDTEIVPTDWVFLAKDAHHPAGILRFPLADAAGRPWVKFDGTDDPGSVELLFRDLGVPLRAYSWQLPIE